MYYRGMPFRIVDGCAFDLSCCPAIAQGTSFVRLGTRPSPVTAILSRKVSGDLTRACDVVSSKESLYCQSWAPQHSLLLYKEGDSVHVPCLVRTILKFITTTQLSIIIRIQIKCSDTNCNNPAFQSQNNNIFFKTRYHFGN